LVAAFDQSPLAGMVELQRVDVSQPRVIVATTGQGSEITFGLDNVAQQIRRWQGAYGLGAQQHRTIASLDLAVANNVPVRWCTNSLAPGVSLKVVKPLKPPKSRRQNA
jgi:hypothetical protein